MKGKSHAEAATALEDRAADLLEVVKVGGIQRSPTGKQIAQAEALATLALSHRTAAHTEVVQGGRRP